MSLKLIELVASPGIDIYTEVQNALGADRPFVQIEQCGRNALQPIPGPMAGYICIGHVKTFPARSSTWWALMALESDAVGIVDRYWSRFSRSTASGTPPNTSVVLTTDELAFIEERFGGSKSAAIHAALAALKRSE